MKRIMSIFSCIAVVATAVLFSSCDKIDNNLSHTEGQIRTLTASTEKTPETKTQLGGTDNVEVHWTGGDKVQVYAGSSNAEFTATTTDNSMIANLSGTLEGTLTSAIYPASMADKTEEFYITIPATQTYEVGNVTNGVMPMVSRIASDNQVYAGLRNLCGILKLQITGSEVVKTIEFISSDYIAGRARIIFGTDGIPNLLPFSGATSEVITLDCGAEGVQLYETAATLFHIVIPPTSSNYFTIRVTTVDGKVMTKTTQDDISNRILRNTITTMPEIAFVDDNVTSVKVGDFYYNDGVYSTVKLEGRDADILGVVFQVIGESGKEVNGKIVSLDYVPVNTEWGFMESRVTEANSNENGRHNMRAVWEYTYTGDGTTNLKPEYIEKTAGNFDYFPIFEWVHAKNLAINSSFDGTTAYADYAKGVWYLPAYNELQYMFSSELFDSSTSSGDIFNIVEASLAQIATAGKWPGNLTGYYGIMSSTDRDSYCAGVNVPFTSTPYSFSTSEILKWEDRHVTTTRAILEF